MRLYDEALIERQRAREDYGTLFVHSVRPFESFCRLAGEHEMAARVRPSERNPGQTEVEPEETPDDAVQEVPEEEASTVKPPTEPRWPGLPATQISDILIDPGNAARAYVSYYRTIGSRLYRTLDQGVSWTNVTGDLPSGVGVTALAIDWRPDPPGLYLGTGAGVWSSQDGGATWGKDGTDLPNVNIGDLQISRDRDTLYAGTFGRGAWRALLPALCLGDLNLDDVVDFDDLILVLAAWGNKGGPEDLDQSGLVDFDDLLIVLAAWGRCT